MKLSMIVCALITFTVAITGCANTTTLQAKLEKSEAHSKDLQDRLELAEGAIQELQAEASKDHDLCEKAMAKLREAEHAAIDAYNSERPIVIRMATDAYNASKPIVEAGAREALDWTTDKIRGTLPKPDPSLTPAK